MWADVDRCWVESYQVFSPRATTAFPKLANSDIGPESAETAPASANIGAESTNPGTASTQVGASTKLGLKLGRIRANLTHGIRHIYIHVARNGPELGHPGRQNEGDLGTLIEQRGVLRIPARARAH